MPWLNMGRHSAPRMRTSNLMKASISLADSAYSSQAWRGANDL
jgi:hypothetical protein